MNSRNREGNLPWATPCVCVCVCVLQCVWWWQVTSGRHFRTFVLVKVFSWPLNPLQIASLLCNKWCPTADMCWETDSRSNKNIRFPYIRTPDCNKMFSSFLKTLFFPSPTVNYISAAALSTSKTQWNNSAWSRVTVRLPTHRLQYSAAAGANTFRGFSKWWIFTDVQKQCVCMILHSVSFRSQGRRCCCFVGGVFSQNTWKKSKTLAIILHPRIQDVSEAAAEKKRKRNHQDKAHLHKGSGERVRFWILLLSAWTFLVKFNLFT